MKLGKIKSKIPKKIQKLSLSEHQRAISTKIVSACKKQSQKPYIKQLINLERLDFAGKYLTSALSNDLVATTWLIRQGLG